MRDENFWADRRAVKIELRKLYDRYPKAFEDSVRSLQTYFVFCQTFGLSEEKWREVILPPADLVRGKPTIPEWIFAMLLTQYRVRPPGETREDFIERMVKDGLTFNGAYTATEWTNSSTVAAHLKAAEKMEKDKPDFAAGVEICMEWAASHPPDVRVRWFEFEFRYPYARRGLRVAFKEAEDEEDKA